MNDNPVDCQNASVTEPQREVVERSEIGGRDSESKKDLSPSVFLLRKNPAPSSEGAKGVLQKIKKFSKVVQKCTIFAVFAPIVKGAFLCKKNQHS